MYGNLQTTTEGAKKLLLAGDLAQSLGTGGGTISRQMTSKRKFVVLTERIPYDLGGTSPCTRAEYKGYQVYLDDSLDSDAGINFVEEVDGIIFDSDDDEAAGNLMHLSDHSFLRLGMIYEAFPFRASSDRVEGWMIQTIDYEGPFQASLDPDDPAVITIGAYREDDDYPFEDALNIRVQGVDINGETDNPRLTFEEVEKVTPDNGAGYIWYKMTVELGFNNTPVTEQELEFGNEIPEEEMEDTTDQDTNSEPQGAFKYTLIAAIAYYIKKNGVVCHLEQIATGGLNERSLSKPLDQEKLKEDLDVDGFTYEAGCNIDISATGTDTSVQTISVDIGNLGGAGLIAGTGTGTCADVLDVGQGCGITVNADDIAVDGSALAGAGIIDPGTTSCELNIGAGDYIDVNTDDVAVNRVDLATDMAGNCLTAAAGVLNVAMVGGNDISVVGCTINYTGGGGGGGKVYKVDAGDCGAIAVATATGTATDTYTVSFVPSVIAGNGLVATDGASCTLDIGAGCGITVNANDIEVDLYSDGGLTTTGTGSSCELMIKIDPACDVLSVGVDGLLLDAGNLVNPLEGLIVGTGTESCQLGIKLESGCNALQLGSDGLGFYSGVLAGKGIEQNATDTCALDINLSSDASMEFVGTPEELQLINDEASPGNNEFYGTGNSGTKGWFNFSTLAGTGIAFAGNDFDIDINSLTAVSGTPPVDADVDTMAIYDSSTASVKKTTLEQLLESIDGYDPTKTQEIVNASGTIAWVTVEAC